MSKKNVINNSKENLKEKEHKIIFVYLCSAIGFIICLYFRSLFIIENIFKSIIITFLVFLPTLISFLLIYLNEKNKLKNKWANIIQLLIIVPSFIFVAITFSIALLIETIDGVENVVNYRRIYNYYKFDYFPKKIPKNANNIMFHYNPSLFQGGEIMSLYFKSDNHTINQYIKKYKKRSKWVGNFENKTDSYYFNEEIYIFTPYHESTLKEMNEFTIYYLDGECDNSGYCNHAWCEIIAINNKTNEIIFFFSQW